MNIEEVAQIWQKVKAELEKTVSESAIMWIDPLEPAGFEDDCFTLITGQSMAVSILKQFNYEDFQNAFKKVLGRDVNFKIIYDETAAKRIKKDKDKQMKKTQKEQALSDDVVFNLAQMQSSSNLNLRYTFENFVVGSNNEFAQAAAMAVAKHPARKGYNPLFIYGASGLGKTHLMQAIGHYILFNMPKLKVKYIKTEAFTNELISNIRKSGDVNEKMSRFRQKYRNVDVLLLDDIQFIEGKDRTIQEVFNTFDSLYNKNKQIVITSDRQPKDISDLPERLLSRFEWGLVVDLTPPDFETRFAILKNLAEAENTNISDDVLELIANNFKKNVRELEGAFNIINAYASIKKVSPDIDTAKRVLKINEKNTEITPQLIINVVCDKYNITEEELKSNARSDNITYPRRISIYLIRELLNLSYKKIAEIFNKKHPTMLAGYEDIKEKIKLNNSLRKEIENLKSEINSK